MVPWLTGTYISSRKLSAIPPTRMIASPAELKDVTEQLCTSGLAMGADALDYVTETESLIEQAYNGRSIFELIQNARDASQLRGEDGSIRFELAAGVLSAANTGQPFSAAGIRAISRVGRSDKHSAEMIGFKGLGFKSVRQLTDTPRVVTAHGTVQFDAELTRQQHGSLGLAELPLFLLPYYAPAGLSEVELAAGVVTRIELPLRDGEAEQWVYRSFRELHLRQLLFLGRIRELHVELPNLSKRFQLTTSGRFLEGQVSGQAPQRFWLLTPAAGIVIPPELTSGLSKKEQTIVAAMGVADVRVALEVDAAGAFKPVPAAPLHLFYPLETLTGLRFLVHGYFLVNPERTALRKANKLNTFLLEQIGTFLGQTVCEQVREAGWNPCEVLHYVRQPQAGLEPLYTQLRAALRQQAFILSEGHYYRPGEVMTINPRLASGLPLRQVGNQHLVVVASPDIRQWLREEFCVRELEAEGLPAALEAACRPRLAAGDWDFFTELYRFLGTKGAPDMSERAVLLTEHGVLVAGSRVEVFYLDHPQQAPQLPASLQDQVQLLHSRFRFDGQLGLLQSKTSLRNYERASLARALLREMGPQKTHNWEILRVLYDLRHVVPAVDFQREGWLPTRAGQWVRPWVRPVYAASDELTALYPQGRFLNEAVFGRVELPDDPAARADFLGWAGVWQRPGVYLADERPVPATQRRYRRIASTGSPTLTLTNDRLLDVPATPTPWFGRQLLRHWPTYQYFLRQETGTRNLGLASNTTRRVVSSPQRSTWSEAVEWLQTRAWLWLAGEETPRRVQEVVIVPEGAAEADQLILAYLPLLEVPLDVFQALQLDLDLVSWQAGSSSDPVRVLQLFHQRNAPTLAALSAPSRTRLLKAYNRLLSRLYEYCAARNTYRLAGLEHTPLLAVDTLTQQLSWQAAPAIYYVDDPALYESLPAVLQARLQPQFTKTEPNQFGKIAGSYGLNLSTVLKVEVEPGPARRELPAWEALGDTLLDFLSIVDARLPEQLTEAEAQRLLRFPVWEVDELHLAFRWREEAPTAGQPADYAPGEDAAGATGLYVRRTFPLRQSLHTGKALVGVFARLLPNKEANWPELESTLTDYQELENKERFVKRHGDPQRRQELRYLLLGDDDGSPAAFWQAVRRATGQPELAGEALREANIAELAVSLELPADQLAAFAAGQFRYEQLSVPGNRRALHGLLRTLNCPLEALQRELGDPLSVEGLWGNEWTKLKRTYKPAFRDWLYDQLQATSRTATGLQRPGYRHWLQAYDELPARPYPAELTNSLLAHFYHRLRELLPAVVEAGELAAAGGRPEQWYLAQYREARQQLQARVAGQEQQWLTEFLLDSQRDSLLYFGEVATLARQFEVWARPRRQVPILADEEPADPLHRFRNLTHVYGGRLAMHALAPAAASAEPAAGKGEGGPGTGTSTGYGISGAAASSAHAETGRVAEQWVCAWLQQRHESVRWTSYNAVSVGVAHPWYNPEGSDSLGYDLSYWDAALEEEIAVEVKSSAGSRLSFFMSRQELAVAAQRGAHYRLLYVTHALNNEQRRIYDLGNPFPLGMKSVMDNSCFTTEWEKVRISFTGSTEPLNS